MHNLVCVLYTIKDKEIIKFLSQIYMYFIGRKDMMAQYVDNL